MTKSKKNPAKKTATIKKVVKKSAKKKPRAHKKPRGKCKECRVELGLRNKTGFCRKCLKNNRKGIGGVPTKMTKELIAKLEQAFSIGCTDREACIFAEINPSTLYDYQLLNTEFTKRKESLKEKPILRARMNIVTALNKNDKEMSKWFLERKRKEEFSTRTEQIFPEEIKYSLIITEPDGKNDKLDDNTETGPSEKGAI